MRNPIDKEAAMAMLAENKTQTEVAARFGVTRQRIQQLAKKNGVESRFSSSSAQKRKSEITKLLLSGESPERVAAWVGVAVASVIQMQSKLGLGKLVQRAKLRKPILDKIEKAVGDGMSVNAAARAFGFTQSNLSMHLGKRGAKSRAPSRWRDVSYRYTLIPELRAEGKTWKEINDRLSEIDGWPYVANNLAWNWCRNHIPHLVGDRSRGK